MNPKHRNTGSCDKCKEIMNVFPGLDERLVNWFKAFQSLHPDAHIAYAGRGQKDQEEAYATKHSKAKWGQSAHNYNLAIDVFRLTINGASWDAVWYKNVLAPCVAINHELYWGGLFTTIRDLPHVEILGWEELVKSGKAKLV